MGMFEVCASCMGIEMFWVVWEGTKKTLLKELLVIYSIQCKYFAKSKMPFVILET